MGWCRTWPSSSRHSVLTASPSREAPRSLSSRTRVGSTRCGMWLSVVSASVVASSTANTRSASTPNRRFMATESVPPARLLLLHAVVWVHRGVCDGHQRLRQTAAALAGRRNEGTRLRTCRQPAVQHNAFGNVIENRSMFVCSIDRRPSQGRQRALILLHLLQQRHHNGVAGHCITHWPRWQRRNPCSDLRGREIGLVQRPQPPDGGSNRIGAGRPIRNGGWRQHRSWTWSTDRARGWSSCSRWRWSRSRSRRAWRCRSRCRNLCLRYSCSWGWGWSWSWSWSWGWGWCWRWSWSWGCDAPAQPPRHQLCDRVHVASPHRDLHPNASSECRHGFCADYSAQNPK